MIKIHRHNMFRKMAKNLLPLLLVFAMLSCQTEIPVLNSEWLYIADSTASYNENTLPNDSQWRKIKIPASWHDAETGLLDYQGVVWFKKNIDLESVANEKRLIIEINAVDYIAALFVNKKFVGEHEGGYTPFSFDISKYVKTGSNELLMRINDPKADQDGTDGISYWHVPHGKQNWYVQNSGIWQGVELKLKELNYIENVLITPYNNGNFESKIVLNRLDTKNQTYKITLSIYDPLGKIVYTNDLIKPESNDVTVKGVIEDPILWDTENPNLYVFKVTYGNDTFSGRFGFREFVVQDGEFLLNGKPFYMIGALDQDFYPESNYITPSKEYLIDEMKKAKAMGLNTLRCHIKIPVKEYLDAADEIGLLVWSELPNWDVFDESVKQRYRDTFHEVMNRDWNHPSFVIWGIINESWGINLSKEDQRKWLLEEFDYTKKYAENRVIVDNSACWGNFHLKTDINDYHTYYSIPENRHKFDNTIKEVAERADWLFSKYGDSKETGKEALIISEFGNWGLPALPEKKPMWFNRMFLDDWITLPEGVEKRFLDFKYDRIFSSFNVLASYSQWNQFNSLKYEIERIRLGNELKGYIITEFTDINWECNGLLDMWRNPKIFYDKLSIIQNPDILIPVVEKYNFWDSEKINLDVYFSHYSAEVFDDLKLEWYSGGDKLGEEHLNNVNNYSVELIHKISLSFSKVKNPKKVKIDFKLHNLNEEVIAENYTEIFLYPTLTESRSDIYLTNALDDSAINILKEGGNVICIFDGTSSIPDGFPLKITSRDEDWYDGNWASNLNWVSNSEVFSNMGISKILGFEIDNVAPKFVITDIPKENFDDVLSGMFVAWIYLNSGYIVQMNAGNGKLILVTFDMYKNYKSDPFASTLLSALSNYINSDSCKPKLQWKL